MQRMIINLLTYYWDRKTLFDNWVVPTQIVKQDLIDRLLVECGELELYITNPELLEYVIGTWSRGKLPIWQKIADILELEYNPIWNVDGKVVHTETTTGTQETEGNRNLNRGSERDRNENGTRKENTQNSGTENYSENYSENEQNETINTLSADNSSAWSNDTKTNYTGNKTGNKTGAKNSFGESETETTNSVEENETITDVERETDAQNTSHETRNTWEDVRKIGRAHV